MYLLGNMFGTPKISKLPGISSALNMSRLSMATLLQYNIHPFHIMLNHTSRQYHSPVSQTALIFYIVKCHRFMAKFISGKDILTVTLEYYTIHASFIAATCKHNILPDLKSITPTFDFPDHILPPSHYPVYQSSLAAWILIPRELDKTIQNIKSIPSE